ncbi:ribonuclease E/G family protein [Erythrobacter mangrovi]|uniref:Ribonuclease n=1 Tax=Erythrobacter mangrovi TaxID=2739433 RepID=A0A7D3X9D8_9SPHN|nr:ribonuclease [Erythrobacter mangrovi]QKG69990.1 ribonuclease [Erythrobacter mangrovi]
MAEWVVEHGIGEQRALLLDGDRVLAAKLRWPGELHAGQPVKLTLYSKPTGASRGVARDAGGTEVLVDKLPAGLSEGMSFDAVITRAAIAETGRLKRPQARHASAGTATPDGSADIFERGNTLRRFAPGLWEEVWDAAASGEVSFPGGSLLFSVTPAMTVVDIDGDLPSRELALAAVPALARALPMFDLGGSIGIDFPTLEAKADRKAVDSALEDAFADWPHERTAMNGFGFVHIVARLDGPSLLHRFASSRVGMAARMALRRAEMVEGPGATLLSVHPALKAKLTPEWFAELERRTGRPTRVETNPGLAIEAAQAQSVPL